jgi:hypothetical protein
MKQDVKITNVVVDEDGFHISTEEDVHFFMAKKLIGDIVPKTGDIVTLHTYGGSFIRGMDINSKPIYYKTDEDLEKDAEAFREQEKKRKQASFEKNKPTLDKLFSLLPKLLQHRIEMFRTFVPNYRIEWEMYELTAVFLGYKVYLNCKAQSYDEFYQKVDKFDIGKYVRTHKELKTFGMSLNQGDFACYFAKGLFGDVYNRNIDINNPKLDDLKEAWVMYAPDAISPITGGTLHPRGKYVEEYITKNR